jgi:hypothetical protein
MNQLTWTQMQGVISAAATAAAAITSICCWKIYWLKCGSTLQPETLQPLRFSRCWTLPCPVVVHSTWQLPPLAAFTMKALPAGLLCQSPLLAAGAVGALLVMRWQLHLMTTST